MIEKKFTNLDQIGVVHNEPLTVFQLLPGSESPEMSIALILLNGINGKVLNEETNAMYIVVAGTGCFILWNEQGHELREVKAGDCVGIPKGTPYQDIGLMIMVSINHKAFNSEQVKYLE